MSYFLSKLKEQATSFQSIAKNMMVYENTDKNEEDEEVLDQTENSEDEGISTQNRPKQ